MATPFTVTIPTIGPTQRIEDYEPLFKAEVSTLLTTEEGRKAAIRLLPAYISRREVDRVIAIEAAKEESIDGAFKVLRDNLDPPIDKYEATRRYYDMHWASGEAFDDFFVRLWKEAKRAEHTVL